MYDHSVRVPFMISGPGIPQGKKIDAPIYHQDIMPTTLELAEAKRPAHVQFHSLLPLIHGESEGHLDAVYGGYVKLQRMVKMDGYKLILYPKAKAARLYNVANDPEELRDVAGETSSLPIMKRLFAKLLELQEETGDKLDIASVYPQLGS